MTDDLLHISDQLASRGCARLPREQAHPVTSPASSPSICPSRFSSRSCRAWLAQAYSWEEDIGHSQNMLRNFVSPARLMKSVSCKKTNTICFLALCQAESTASNYAGQEQPCQAPNDKRRQSPISRHPHLQGYASAVQGSACQRPDWPRGRSYTVE